MIPRVTTPIESTEIVELNGVVGSVASLVIPIGRVRVVGEVTESGILRLFVTVGVTVAEIISVSTGNEMGVVEVGRKNEGTMGVEGALKTETGDRWLLAAVVVVVLSIAEVKWAGLEEVDGC